ncbi:MAG TPA: hypothetical protein VME22_32925 [Solirubrobacteraceae bacterium]|nr:hypothetical protein [Solirubrobacteraceae bacterium]
MLEAGAALPDVMDQAHADSKTVLEIYAKVQKRVSRRNAHAAFAGVVFSSTRSTTRTRGAVTSSIAF